MGEAMFQCLLKTPPQINALTLLVIVMTALVTLMANTVKARDLIVTLPDRAGLAQMGEDGQPYGSLVDLVKAIDDVYVEGDIIILGLYPFTRSIKNVVSGKADFHPVLITSIEPDGFVYSSARIAISSTILYSNTDSPRLDLNNLWKYQFDTGRGHAELINQEFLRDYNKLPLKITEFNYIDQGLKRLAIGRTDGVIMEQDSGDMVLRKLKLKNIRRELRKKENIHAIIQLGEKGQEVDKILTKALDALEQQGRLQELSDNIHKPWNDWQPYEMNW